MTLRVGRIPFLNCEPFYRHLARGACRDLIAASPRSLAGLARRTPPALDAAPLPLTDCFALEPAFEPLGTLGIAVRGPVRSVLVHADVPLAALSGRAVSVCEETSCSAALLRVLLARRYECRDVRFERSAADDPGCAARLEIGDAALAGTDRARERRFDLGAEWFDWTGLPFVFARWVVSSGADPVERDALLRAVEESLDRSLADIEGTASAGDRLGLTRSASREYLAAFAYRLGPAEEEGAARFRALLEGLDVRP